ncbi:shikimate dehydrogenase family protein [Aureibacter tunicatorum]|uniref:Shikimate dehydrogenase n=1 Tax=Aureibacter tunicatorum TaxID=866807 RepID=A0AAE3XRJ6_9BACT|nr:shikimate dehydrogenase [Aureibacter tunicatorum]MDR6240139.1 shikimate dehydrogenase [Aureibacter tunicatorum]BDD05980.1 shikimate 5-dehydrogenase [Aureibacter tunicatorum]
MNIKHKLSVNPNTKFIFSTSGSASSIEAKNNTLNELKLNLAYFTFPDFIDAPTYAGLLRSPICKAGAVTGKNGLKTKIINELDWVEPLAKKTKAVNTVINDNGKLKGYNTDYYGLKVALEEHIDKSEIRVKKAVVYGNGGVSGVAYHVLKHLGIDVVITGRNIENVQAKKTELGIVDGFDVDEGFDLLVDATPVSSEKDFLKIALGLDTLLKSCKMVFCHNMPEKDNKHNYLKEYCERHGKHFIEGREMYIPQIVKQYHLMFEGMTNDLGSSINDNDILKEVLRMS